MRWLAFEYNLTACRSKLLSVHFIGIYICNAFLNLDLFQLSLVLCFQSSGDIWYLIEMEGFGFATILTMVFAGQVYLRYKEPALHRPIKVCIFTYGCKPAGLK